ncbi:MAG: NAD(+)/NADH kinase [Deltaproteobacteria bacterium]|nr:NAD(+)/NADH kinase [Deltaproteobacteria bacterium]MBI3017268.1 NAD(+)/NADH kinase [Deltaproteobacteria bacterium]
MPAVKKIGFVIKKGNAKAFSFVEKLLPWLEKQGYRVYLPEPLFSEIKISGKATLCSLEDLGSVDLLVTFGGDGTFIRGVRVLEGAKVPVVGVNFGEFGFLTQTHHDNFEKTFVPFLKGDFRVEERSKLKAEVHRKGKVHTSYHALNDVVLHTFGIARIAKYKVAVDSQPLMLLRADGMVMSTPTGSTAYSFAAGGPISDPQSPLMLFTPICPQNVAYRPLIFSDTSMLEVETSSRNSEVLLTIDGQEQLQIEEGDQIKVQKSTQKAYFAKSLTYNYFEVLRNKLFSGSI